MRNKKFLIFFEMPLDKIKIMWYNFDAALTLAFCGCAAKFSLYHLATNLSSTFCKNFAQNFIPKFVQNFLNLGVDNRTKKEYNGSDALFLSEKIF